MNVETIDSFARKYCMYQVSLVSIISRYVLANPYMAA